MIWNPGQLPDEWTLEKLLGKHPSQPFNPLVANALFRAGYIEAWGRGIEKIQRECREYGVPEPTFDHGMSGLMLTFHANPHRLREVLGDGARLDKAEVSVESSVETAASVETPVTASVETQVKTSWKIIDLLRKNPSMTLA